jgi:hypothetical protein
MIAAQTEGARPDVQDPGHGRLDTRPDVVRPADIHISGVTHQIRSAEVDQRFAPPIARIGVERGADQ